MTDDAQHRMWMMERRIVALEKRIKELEKSAAGGRAEPGRRGLLRRRRGSRPGMPDGANLVAERLIGSGIPKTEVAEFLQATYLGESREQPSRPVGH
jgi:hypothetical protein